MTRLLLTSAAGILDIDQFCGKSNPTYFCNAFTSGCLFFLPAVTVSITGDSIRQHYEAAEAYQRAGNLIAAEVSTGDSYGAIKTRHDLHRTRKL